MAETHRNPWRLPLQYGAIAGAAILYVALVGMVEMFRARSIIGGVLTLDQLLLYLPPIVAGLLVGRHPLGPQSVVERILAGLVIGLVSALPTAALILLSTVVDVRQMFVSVSPALISMLTFEQETLALGIAILIGLLTVGGMLGVLLPLLPRTIGAPLAAGVGWMLGVGLLSELAIQILRQLDGNTSVRAFFRNGALKPEVAVAIFVIAALLTALWRWQRANVRTQYERLGVAGQAAVQRTGFGLMLILLLALPWVVGVFLSEVLVNVGLYVLMGLGLNIAVGLAGLLDLGYVTNFAVGAYVMAVLTSTGPLGIGQFNFWMIVPVSVLCAMFTGFVLALPVLRMRGDYLAIATLGFGEIIRLLALSDWLRPYIGGSQGILFIPSPQLFGITFSGPQTIYYLLLGACFLTLFVMIRLNNSRTGRQWMALREDEDAAAAMGIDTVKTKVLAFTLSAAAGGLAGAIFAAKLGTIFPHSFNLLISINTLAVIIVGGMGSIPGVVLGALVLVGLPELLREFAEYRLLLYGALLIAMMLLRPEGLWPSAIRRRELYDESTDTVGASQVNTAPAAGD